jgi:ribonuclease HII
VAPDHAPNLWHEHALSGLVAGVDEAGRGPWAGPVVAAAVIIGAQAVPDGINDSKKLTPAKRNALFDRIIASCRCGIGSASVEEIDALNILQATGLAMRRAIEALPVAPTHALVDGNRPPALPCAVTTLVGGDALSLSIAAASILAKVTRDRLMSELARDFPGYGWERNAGYGTAAHQKGLATLGVTLHHRRSFAPIKALLHATQAA